MNILVISDSYKGSKTSKEVNQYIKEGIKIEYPKYNIKTVQIADGGEGSLEAIKEVIDANFQYVDTINPIGESIKGKYLLTKDRKTAIIEIANFSVLTTIDKEKINILKSTTYGSGILIKDALDKNVEKIYICLGGSGTNDCGIGLSNALGAKFLDKNKKEVKANLENLHKIKSIDLRNFDNRVNNVEFKCLSDVKNPLCGPNGATKVYGPQKGIKKSQIEKIDRDMYEYGRLLEDTFNKNIINVKGAGAAGGLGACLLSFTNCEILNGGDEILKILKVEKLIENSDLIITGEGFLDNQSLNGKLIERVTKLSKKHNKIIYALVGSFELNKELMDNLHKIGFDGIFTCVTKPMTIDDAIENTEENIINASRNLIRIYSSINDKSPSYK